MSDHVDSSLSKSRSLWILPDKKPNNSVEVRLAHAGELDEIVVRDADGNCLFHMECMDRGECIGKEHWWMRFSSTEKHPLPSDLIVNLGPGGASYSMEEP